MAFTFDSTVGTSTANSYISVSEADDYMAGTLDGPDYWDALTVQQRQAALVQATRRIDRVNFGGRMRYYGVQSLQWPRSQIVERNGSYGFGWENYDSLNGYAYIPNDVLPSDLKAATCELALYYIKAKEGDAGTVSDYDLETLTSYKVGPIQVGIKDKIKADRLPTIVAELLGAIGSNSIGDGATIRFTA